MAQKKYSTSLLSDVWDLIPGAQTQSNNNSMPSFTDFDIKFQQNGLEIEAIDVHMQKFPLLFYLILKQLC